MLAIINISQLYCRTVSFIETSACKVTFHFAKLRIRRSIQFDLSEYYAIQSQHKSWDKIVENRNTIPDFPEGCAMALF
jgi:hypothetical protein